VSRCHEVACHGYTHRGYNDLKPEEERGGHYQEPEDTGGVYGRKVERPLKGLDSN